jgi:hypothetical protein
LELERGRFTEALAAYEAVLKREADDPWAKASALYARFVRDNDVAARAELERLAATGEPRAGQLLERLNAPA